MEKEVKKMGRPKATKKSKSWSVYIYEDEVQKVCEVVGGETPNEFVKSLFKILASDPDKMIEVMGVLYGEKSREARMAKLIKEDLEDND